MIIKARIRQRKAIHYEDIKVETDNKKISHEEALDLIDQEISLRKLDIVACNIISPKHLRA